MPTTLTRPEPIERTRNIGIAAHIDAGKTTLTERMLFYTGEIHEPGDVDLGNTTTDYDPIEQRRGITIMAAAISCHWEPARQPGLAKPFEGVRHRINIIDTPGHVDFTAEVERSMRVLDGAVTVFSGVEGVQPQSEKVWRQAIRYGVPRIAFINKMDRIGADFDRVLDEMRHKLGAVAWPVLAPLGKENDLRGQIDILNLKAIVYDLSQQYGVSYHVEDLPESERERAEYYRKGLVEAVANVDEVLSEAFLAEREIGALELAAAIRRATIANQFVPVTGGSAFKFIGVQGVLDAVINYLPNPIELPPAQGTHPETGKEVPVKRGDAEPYRALIFKLMTDEYSRRHIFARIYSGTLQAGQMVLNAVTGKRERITRVYEIHADKEIGIEAAFAGDIAAVGGLKEVATGHTLCDPSSPVLMEPPTFPVPVVSMAIEPKTRVDQDRLEMVLQRLVEDDPTLKVSKNPETGQTIISGMGELHLEVVRERMLTRFKVATRSGAPVIAYRETITTTAVGEGKHIRQVGNTGQYGHVQIQIGPAERGSGLTIVDKLPPNLIPPQFIPAIKRGIASAGQSGALAAYPLVDVHVEIIGGSTHVKDANELAYEVAASMAFQDAASKANPVLLEPIMLVECTTPPEFQGDIAGDLQRRRALVRAVEPKGAIVSITAEVPLSEMFGYANAIRSLSKGRAEHSMEPLRFDIVPPDRTKKLLGLSV